ARGGRGLPPLGRGQRGGTPRVVRVGHPRGRKRRDARAARDAACALHAGGRTRARRRGALAELPGRRLRDVAVGARGAPEGPSPSRRRARTDGVIGRDVSRGVLVVEVLQLLGGIRRRRARVDPGRGRRRSRGGRPHAERPALDGGRDRKSTRLNSSHDQISYAVFCLKKKKKKKEKKQN